MRAFRSCQMIVLFTSRGFFSFSFFFSNQATLHTTRVTPGAASIGLHQTKEKQTKGTTPKYMVPTRYTCIWANMPQQQAAPAMYCTLRGPNLYLHDPSTMTPIMPPAPRVSANVASPCCWHIVVLRRPPYRYRSIAATRAIDVEVQCIPRA